ncbi:carboxymuconolactone decarboxylase family protein [Cupriavidus sp. NPDC089707]|uniref:carboxymuconolactone decarboxylase family protein n=1 Tax=Cupriavidus sp. NPDC089707 TaxID=3363963 RepID=UPI0037FDD84C
MSSETNGELQLSTTPVCDHLQATGNWNPAWDAFAELDPVWTEKFMSMAMHPMFARVLEPKVLEFIAIAVDASCTHMYAPGTRRHIRKALELGATKEEIAAVLQAVSVLGIHTSSLGAPILLEELAALQREHAKGERAAA